MTITIGRGTLNTPTGEALGSGPAVVRQTLTSGLDSQYALQGNERGTSGTPTLAQDRMNVLEKDLLRAGALYCTSSDSLFPSGYYVVTGGYSKDRGRPRVRKWRLRLRKALLPIVARQAEDDNISGVDTDESLLRAAEEGFSVVYTATTTETAVLRPRSVGGAEALNLPAGTYRMSVRFTTAPSVSILVRGRLTDLAGTTISPDGAQVAPDGTQLVVDLGLFTVPQANTAANWYELLLDRTSSTESVRIDSVQLVPV